mmetsp:Transcript_15819/g.40147  ORF Transcript_15819/g.40147 Transcript_15819/m.40147 type:complete len:133 (-) Transcript_15819:422-820(-)|eukprot:5366676-Prymnesium_polylepis.1
MVRTKAPVSPNAAARAVQQAQMEGLSLVRAANATGFKSVTKNHMKFRLRLGGGVHGKARFLGNFMTPEEAALAYARHLGPVAAAAEAAAAAAVLGEDPVSAQTGTQEPLPHAVAVNEAVAAEGAGEVHEEGN